ncbi:MAG: deoxyhypusine synthase family protein [Candidatus Micrarchaeota archaeon]
MAGEITNFVDKNYKHFNAAALKDAAVAYKKHIDAGGKMLVAMGGAMSTAELGISLAEMIRAGKVHAISCTGANLEEDLFNLVANKSYKRIPNYRYLTPQEEQKLLESHLNRVTDTCIPEEEAMRKIEKVVLRRWMKTQDQDRRLFPHEYLYNIITSGELEADYDIDKKNSWLAAAAEKNLPIFIGGWEDSTLGNFFVSNFIKGKIDKMTHMRTGLEYMKELIDWYQKETQTCSIGFFQIGGGIAGDFPICVVPLIEQDLQKDIKKWGYFCQISDSTTSYGSYSGAVPNEKITWGKLGIETPKYIIESDATIVAPLIFAYVLGQ